MPNNTQFAQHFQAATSALLDGMANPAGPVFNQAKYEAGRAMSAAFPGAEHEAGQTLVNLVSNVAKIYGFNIR